MMVIISIMNSNMNKQSRGFICLSKAVTPQNDNINKSLVAVEDFSENAPCSLNLKNQSICMEVCLGNEVPISDLNEKRIQVNSLILTK